MNEPTAQENYDTHLAAARAEGATMTNDPTKIELVRCQHCQHHALWSELGINSGTDRRAQCPNCLELGDFITVPITPAPESDEKLPPIIANALELGWESVARHASDMADKAEDEVARLRAELKQAQAERDSNKMSVQIIQSNRDEWERSWGDVVRQRDAAIARAEAAERDLKEQTEIHAIWSTNEAIRAERDALRARVGELEGFANSLMNRIGRMGGKFDELEVEKIRALLTPPAATEEGKA